jgi:Zn-dependent peptidase ImmA (M78 family)
MNHMPDHRNTNPQAKAESLLARLGIHSAPVPVDKIAKSLGALLRYSPLDEELSGMICIKDGVPIIGVNSLHHPNRQRFTIAHEIGHLELHREILTNSVHVDKEFPVMMRGVTASQGTDRNEIDANMFAAHLLIPKVLLDQLMAGKTFDIDDDKPLEELAKRFRVSKKMMEYRIANLI